MAFIIGVVAGLAADKIFNDEGPPLYTTCKINPVEYTQSVMIAYIGASRNVNGIVFVYVGGTVHEYEGKLAVTVRAMNESEWSEHDKVEWSIHHDVNGRYWSQTDENGRFWVRIQFGSNELPIKGGEEYLLRISGGEESATATVTLGRE